MVRWHSRIYLGEGFKERYENIRRDVEEGKTDPKVYLVTLSSNPYEQLDIFSSNMFAEALRIDRERVVVGLAGSKEEAFELVALMAFDALSSAGKVDFRSYFE